MGDYREGSDGIGRRPSTVPLPVITYGQTSTQIFAATPGKRAARIEEQSAAARANAATSPYVGRRVANRPVDAPSGTLGELHRIAAPTARLPSTASGAPLIETGRLDTAAINRVLAELEPVDHTTSFADEITEQLPLVPALAPGRRRAVKHAGRRGPLFRGLPSAPLLLGVAALAVSAGGAIAVGNPATLVGSQHNGVSQASALNGVGGVGSVGTQRVGAPTSRDSARDTLAASTAGPVADPVEAKIQQRSGRIANLANQAEQRSAVIAENIWQAPLDSYRLTARFGAYGLWSSYHTGLDFAAPSGTPIHAIANGVVTSTGYDGSYGNKTVMTLDDGTEIWYAHQTSIVASVGDTVRGGELIGYVGSTGNTTGPHVHIEVRPGGGDPVDPYPAFIEHGITP